MSELNVMPTDSVHRFANTCAWLDFLYSDCEPSHGAIVIVQATRNKLAGIHPVGNGANLVEAAKDMHRHPGSYAKVNLMDSDAMRARSMKTNRPVIGARAEVKTVVSLHLDVDAGKSTKYASRTHALWALDNMPVPPTLVINSCGDDGGFHAYWKLAKPIRIDSETYRRRVQQIATDWNALLRERLGGKLDSTSNLDRVLRCVGVPRKDGGSVCCYRYEPDRLYRLDQFTEVTE